MEIKVNIKTNKNSNLFLRYLWSILGDGKSKGWQTFSLKLGSQQTVMLGMFSCHSLSKEYLISITYKTKGCINTIIFDDVTNEDDKNIITASVKQALSYESALEEQWCSFNIKSTAYTPSHYESEYVILKPYKKNSDKNSYLEILIKVLGYDNDDIMALATKKSKEILNFLSSQMQSVLSMDVDQKENIYMIKNLNKYFEENYDENIPILDENLMISSNVIKFIENIAKCQYTIEMETYLRASKLYHLALKNYCFKHNPYKFDFNLANYNMSLIETSNTLFMSSLEGLTLIFPSENINCVECGQKIFSIRKKVLELVEKYINGLVEKKYIDSFYKDRSSFVHEGIFYSNESYTGTSIPTLQSNSEVVNQIETVNIHHLKNIVSYIFREILLKEKSTLLGDEQDV